MAKPSMSAPVDILSRRMDRVEQGLPTLATKDELHATEAALRGEIRDAAAQSRRHMTMLMERQGRKIQGLIDAQTR